MLDRNDWITIDLELGDDFFSTLVGAIYYQASATVSEKLDSLSYDTPSEMFAKYVETPSISSNFSSRLTRPIILLMLC